MLLIEGVTEKAGRKSEGKLRGDDIVYFRMRVVSKARLIDESLAILDSEEGIAKALAVTRQYGFTLVEGARLIDEMRESLKNKARFSQDKDERSYRGVTRRCKGSDKPLLFHLYDGSDSEKEGRLYIRGEILKQEVIIEADIPYPKTEPSKARAQDVIRDTLPISRYGQFMFRGAAALNLIRVLEDFDEK